MSTRIALTPHFQVESLSDRLRLTIEAEGCTPWRFYYDDCGELAKCLERAVHKQVLPYRFALEGFRYAAEWSGTYLDETTVGEGMDAPTSRAAREAGREHKPAESLEPAWYWKFAIVGLVGGSLVVWGWAAVSFLFWVLL